VLLYLLLDFGALFPYLAANAATPLAAVYLGRIPSGPDDEALVRGLGIAVFLVATFTLYDGVGLSWVTVVSALVLLLLVYLRGMPAMVRTRFSAIDLGREWLVGEEGTVTAELAPSGAVAVRSAQWPARAVGEPLQVGDRVTVVATRGYVLEVSPVTD